MKMKKNLASRLRHRLTLQQPSLTSDGVGGYLRSWEEVAELWSEISPISGNESFEHGQTMSSRRYRIVLRHRGDIHPAMRLVFEGRVFNIRTIINRMEKDQLIEILAEEGVA